MDLRKGISFSKPMSGKDKKTIREKLFLFFSFLNSILQLFDMILRKEENIIIKWIKQKKKRKEKEIKIQFILHICRMDQHNEEIRKIGRETLKYSKKSNPPSFCQI